jgi:hypothetical protein
MSAAKSDAKNAAQAAADSIDKSTDKTLFHDDMWRVINELQRNLETVQKDLANKANLVDLANKANLVDLTNKANLVDLTNKANIEDVAKKSDLNSLKQELGNKASLDDVSGKVDLAMDTVQQGFVPKGALGVLQGEVAKKADDVEIRALVYKAATLEYMKAELGNKADQITTQRKLNELEVRLAKLERKLGINSVTVQ